MSSISAMRSVNRPRPSVLRINRSDAPDATISVPVARGLDSEEVALDRRLVTGHRDLASITRCFADSAGARISL